MEKILFKNSFMGFDRSQVLKYIDDMSREMAEEAEKYSRKVAGLEKEVEDFSRQLARCQESLAVSEEASEELARQVDTLKKTNIQMREQARMYIDAIREKTNELARVKEDNQRLTEHARRLEKENRQWKERQDEIAACMVEASVRAKQIIEEANAKAALAKERFDKNAASLMNRVVDMRSEINRVESQLDTSFQKLREAMRNMDKAGSLIESQVRDYQTRIEKIDDDTSGVQPDVNLPRGAVVKKTLTESVLDSISKLLER